MFLTDTEPAKSHKHLASHLVFSLDGEMEWTVAGERVSCRGIYIDADIEHVGSGNGRFLSFLFVKTSDYAYTIEKRILQDNPYAIFDETLSIQVSEIVDRFFSQPEQIDKKVLEACMITNIERRSYDDRVQAAIDCVESAETIDSETIDKICDTACLSQSRLSHLFKEETGMSLASFLSFEKLRKTYHYLLMGDNITNCCIRAGFDTSSHCATTCNRMFGISLKKVSLMQ